MADKRALLTGGTGFTGSNLAPALLAAGYEVKALVRSPDKAGALKQAGIEIIEDDLQDPKKIDAAVAGCTHVFHIAGLFRQAGLPDSTYHAVNTEAVRHLTAAASRAGVRRFVHCSTIGVHGDVKEIPCRETTPYNPGDIYQRTKMEGEKIALAAHGTNGMEVAVVRPGSTYGPGDLRFLKLFKGIRKGAFLMFGDGTHFMHMAYVDDLVSGFLLCGEHPAAAGEAFIIAGERYVPLNELIEGVAKAVGVRAPKLRFPLGPLLMAASACETVCKPLGIEPPLYRRRCDFFWKTRAFSIDKAKSVLGYTPRVELSEGLMNTADWYRSEGLITPA